MVNYQVVEGPFFAKQPHDMNSLASIILSRAGDIKIWLFEGELGAGKTTLIQAICRKLGVTDQVSSPTYALVHEYHNLKEEVFYHFDFYRLKNETEAREIGCEEYFYSGDLCFIEWGSKVPAIVPEHHLKVQLLVQEDESRKIVIEKYG